MSLHALRDDWLMPMARRASSPRRAAGPQALADVAAAIGAAKGVARAGARRNAERRRRKAIAAALLGGERKADPARQRRRAASARPRSCWRWRNWIGEQTGASVGYLAEAANTRRRAAGRRAAGRGRPERRPDARRERR